MAARAVLIALASALLFAGCGGGKNAARRKAVDAYLQQVSAVQREARPALTEANAAYRRFWSKTKTRTDTQALTHAAATIRALQARLTRFDPPPDARAIHRDLLRFLDLEASFAQEVFRLGRYLPSTAPPLADLAAANKRLRSDFAKAHTAVAQSRVVSAYGIATRSVATRLARLTPPRALRRWHRELVQRLQRVAATASTLNIVLNGKSRAAIIPAATAFRNAVALASPPAPVLRSALIRFNAGADEISTLAAKIRKEYSALDTKLLG